jgi:chromosome segregation ATPase
VTKVTLALALLERRSSDHSDDLRRHVAAALALSAAASALTAKVDALREGAAQHVSDARALKEEIGQSLSDLGSLGEHGTPAFTKVANDLTAAEERAQTALAGAAGLEGRLAELASSAANLQGAAGGLLSRAEGIATAAGTIHETVHDRIAAAVEELETHVAGFKNRGQHLHEQIEAASARFEASRARAKAKFAAVKSQIAGHLAALEAKVSAAVGAARAAAQQKVAEAESEYAKLLALVQIGRANNLPGGDAIGATVQTGIYLYEIDGSKE